MAMEDQRFDPAPDSSARVLLAKQAQLVDADIRYRDFQAQSERVTVWLKRLTILVGVCFAVGVSSMVWSAVRARSVVVEAFDAPPKLAERGLSGNVIAAGLQDALATIQGAVRTTAQRRSIDNAWTGNIAVQVPQTGVSIGEIDRLLRLKLGKETYIGGSVVQNVDGSLSLTVRGTGIPPKTFAGPEDGMTGILASAAEYVYGYSESRLFAIYLFQKRRFVEGESFVTAAFAREDARTRPELLVYWGLMLSQQQKLRPAINKLELGLEQDPTLWRGWNSLVGVTTRADGDEAAWAVGQRLIRAAARAPEDNRPTALGWYNFQSLAQDWTGQIENLELDARKTGGGGSFGVLSASLLANAEMGRHGWRDAARYLDMADIHDETILPQRLLLYGMRFVERGEPARAVPILERFYTIWQGSPAFRFQFDYGPCFLALAYGLNGQIDKSAPLWSVLKPHSTCEAFRADVLEANGDRAGADAVYRSAAAKWQSLPIIYQHWGQTMMKRGDLSRAAVLFARAQRQAPRWADPLKGAGDVLARRGDWQAAFDSYLAARRFAPHWDALDAAIGEARRHVAQPRKGWF